MAVNVTGTAGALQRRLDYTFQQPHLLVQALTHRSCGGDNNERLEYLGDAILNFIVAEILFSSLPNGPEGVLTRLRASLVKKESLAEIAREMELGGHLRLGSGERKSGGWRRDSILANALEAVIGAIYLDGGFDACRRMVHSLFGERFEGLSVDQQRKDPKTMLQELLQSGKHPLPSYSVIAEEGEAHARCFTVECLIDLLPDPVVAQGRSKRIAEQAAADKALELLSAGRGNGNGVT